METKTIVIPDGSNWPKKERAITLVKRWCMVHGACQDRAIGDPCTGTQHARHPEGMPIGWEIQKWYEENGIKTSTQTFEQ